MGRAGCQLAAPGAGGDRAGTGTEIDLDMGTTNSRVDLKVNNTESVTGDGGIFAEA